MSLPYFTVICDGRNLSYEAASLRFSNSDPGGFETCSFSLPVFVDTPRVGGVVKIFDGVSVVWEGRVEEPGGSSSYGYATHSVAAVGFGAALKDNPYAMIYVDRDLGSWQGMPRLRQIISATVGENNQGSGTVIPDVTNGMPALSMKMQGAWTNSQATAQSWYDAGQLCKVARLYVDQSEVRDVVSWLMYYRAIDGEDVNVGLDEIPGGTAIGGSIVLDLTPTTARRRVFAQMYVGLAYPGDDYSEVHLRNLTVMGDHGLPRRGSAPYGLYTSDIVRHALAQEPSIVPGVITEATSYVVPHAVYKDPVFPEQVIEDMTKLMGWHWGVWESRSIFSDAPRLDFRPPPTYATAVVSMADMAEVQFGNRLTDIYNVAQVSYSDAGGSRGSVSVVSDSNLMPEGMTRTLKIDMGTASAGAARVVGENALALADAGNRGVGSCTLPRMVASTGGGRRPAHKLRAGIDRLKITDPPMMGGLPLGGESRRLDTFRVKRVEVTVEGDGPSTRVELDGGADLLEVIQARLQVATQLAGG